MVTPVCWPLAFLGHSGSHQWQQQAKCGQLPDLSFSTWLIQRSHLSMSVYLLGSRGRLQLSRRDEIAALGDTHR